MFLILSKKRDVCVRDSDGRMKVCKRGVWTKMHGLPERVRLGLDKELEVRFDVPNKRKRDLQ